MKRHNERRLRHGGPDPKRGRHIRLAWAAAVVALATVAAVHERSAVLAQDESAQIDQTRQTIDKWVQTRRLISQEERDWELAQEMLQDRIAVVEREIATLKEQIAQAEGDLTEADERREQLVEDNERQKATEQMLLDVVTNLEDRSKRLLPRLPEPVRQTVKPLSQRLPEDSRETELSPSERFQNVIGILNEVNKFNRDIELSSEVLTLDDGGSAEVTAVYVGVAQGYYVGGQGERAGVGTAEADGWVWRADDAIAEQVAQAVAILNNEAVAAYVSLPLAAGASDAETDQASDDEASDDEQ